MVSTEVLIIGAGQAGLAMAYHLQQSSMHFFVVDGNTRLGDSWRKRYDSLLLFTPRKLSSLPGLMLDGDPHGYASRDEFADYIEVYARYFDFPVEMGTRIERLEHVNGHFCAVSSNGRVIEAKAAVLASGGFQKPIIPGMAKNLSDKVKQFSVENYKQPAQVPKGSVLVVGDGATGRDVAAELAATHTVYLATGKSRTFTPERILGISTWWWLEKLSLLTAPSDSFIGKKFRASDSFPNREKDNKSLKSKGVQILPKLTGTNGDTVTFANNVSFSVNSVVWAVGYQDHSDWVAIPEIKDSRGSFVHKHGISPVERLYFVGRPWQTSRASAIIFGVGRDAHVISREIQKDLQVRS